MSKFKIDRAMLARLAHIPDEEVRRDIAETQAEIGNLEREIEGLKLLAGSGTPEEKVAAFKLEHRQGSLVQRRYFVAYLEALLAKRAEVAVDISALDRAIKLLEEDLDE